MLLRRVIGHVRAQNWTAIGIDFISESTGAPLPDGFNSVRGRVIIEPFPLYPVDDPYDPSYTLFIYDSMSAHRAAYETIINTGGLELIRDTALAREIQDYYAYVELVDHFEALMEIARNRFVEAQQQAGVSPVDRRSMEELVGLFKADPAMTAAGKNYWLFTNRHLMYLADLKRSAGTVVGMIEAGVRP